MMASDIDAPSQQPGDHAADEWRYGCKSRPWIKTVKDKPKNPVKDAYERTVQEIDGYRTI